MCVCCTQNTFQGHSSHFAGTVVLNECVQLSVQSSIQSSVSCVMIIMVCSQGRVPDAQHHHSPQGSSFSFPLFHTASHDLTLIGLTVMSLKTHTIFVSIATASLFVSSSNIFLLSFFLNSLCSNERAEVGEGMTTSRCLNQNRNFVFVCVQRC